MSMSCSDGDGLLVAVDVGGTFTDIALYDPANRRSWRAKTPSTPADPSQAFLTGVLAVLAEAGRNAAEIVRVLHGTTVATNMILEGKGANTALLTTEGFRHVLEIGRQDIPRRANLYAWIKPARPIPPERVFEITERIGPGGAVLTPLDRASVAAAAEACRRLDVAAVAICLLHAFANPAHERRVAELLQAALPAVAISLSSEILPVVREYERTLATVFNAYVMPGVSGYVGRLERRLVEAGIGAKLLLMKSNGGVAGAAAIGRAPALTALSGPAAGVVGATGVATAAGIGDLITVDIGGTSADICLVQGGRAGLTRQGRIGAWPLPLPMVDMITIGAGGGSIARVRDGALVVGPESAGAVPGPACYDQGGSEPTVADAHVALGHLPARLLGGRMALDRARAEAVIQDRIARPLGLSLHAAARGILAIADNNMLGAIRVVSVERGHDPRAFTLVPFGGAGPLHGCELAGLLGIGRVLIPPAPGVLSAEGLLAAELKADFSRTLLRRGAIPVTEIDAAFAELEAEAIAWLAEEEVASAARSLTREVSLRYAGQGSELAVPWTGSVAAAEAAFAEAHRQAFGFVLDASCELVTAQVEGRGSLPGPAPTELPPDTGTAVWSTTEVFLPDGPRAVPLVARDTLGAGARFAGPAILTQLDSTTLVPPGWLGEVLAAGSLLLTRVPD